MSIRFNQKQLSAVEDKNKFSQNDNLSLEELREKREGLVGKMKELQADIAKFGFTKGQIYQAKDKLNQYEVVQRDKVVYEYNLIQVEVVDINKRIRRLVEKGDFFRDVVKECMPDRFYQQIVEECKKREAGEKPTKVGIDTDEIRFFKDRIEIKDGLLREYHDALLKAREAINKYVDLNYPEDHNEQIAFMRKFSEINTSIQQKNYYLTKRRIGGY